MECNVKCLMPTKNYMIPHLTESEAHNSTACMSGCSPPWIMNSAQTDNTISDCHSPGRNSLREHGTTACTADVVEVRGP